MSEKRQRITSQSISLFFVPPRFRLHWINLEASWIEKRICLLIIITHELKLTIHCLSKWCTCVIHPRGSCRRNLGEFAVTRTRKIKFIKKNKKQIKLFISVVICGPHHWCYLLYSTKSRFWNLQSSNSVNFFELTNCKITKTLSHLGLQLGDKTALVDLTLSFFFAEFAWKKSFFASEGNTFVLVNQHSRRDVR